MSEASEQREDLLLKQIEVKHFLYCYCGGSLSCLEKFTLDLINLEVVPTVIEGVEDET